MKETVGYLGMGRMGAPMAANLLKAGYPVVVWNRNPAKAEALVFGARAGQGAGLDMRLLASALAGGMAASAVFEAMSPKVLSGSCKPGATADLIQKDLGYIAEAAGEMDLSLPVTGQVRELYQQLLDQVHRSEAPSALVRILERAAGVEVRE